mgnify:CR=1 FL=1
MCINPRWPINFIDFHTKSQNFHENTHINLISKVNLRLYIFNLILMSTTNLGTKCAYLYHLCSLILYADNVIVRMGSYHGIPGFRHSLASMDMAFMRGRSVRVLDKASVYICERLC